MKLIWFVFTLINLISAQAADNKMVTKWKNYFRYAFDTSKIDQVCKNQDDCPYSEQFCCVNAVLTDKATGTKVTPQ